MTHLTFTQHVQGRTPLATYCHNLFQILSADFLISFPALIECMKQTGSPQTTVMANLGESIGIEKQTPAACTF